MALPKLPDHPIRSHGPFPVEAIRRLPLDKVATLVKILEALKRLKGYR